MPPLPADSIHARACKLKCEKILTRPWIIYGNMTLEENVYLQGLRISGPSRKETRTSGCGRCWPGATTEISCSSGRG